MQDQIERDGVRIVASTPEGLLEALRTHRAKVAEIVAERRPSHATGKVSDFVDGIWSPTTMNAVRRLGALGIQLNHLWASLPPDWICPCCRRPKHTIIYAVEIDKEHSAKGRVAIAKAVEHHDHFDSYINTTFNKVLGQNWSRRYAASEEIQRRLSFGFSAFDPTVICEPCNTAEGKAKQILMHQHSIDHEFLRYFSFSVD
jgi:hypothetical protein